MSEPMRVNTLGTRWEVDVAPLPPEIGDRLRALAAVYELFIPWSRGDALAAAHREGEVVVEITEEAGMRLRARLEGPSANRLSEFIVDKVGGPSPAVAAGDGIANSTSNGTS